MSRDWSRSIALSIASPARAPRSSAKARSSAVKRRPDSADASTSAPRMRPRAISGTVITRPEAQGVDGVAPLPRGHGRVDDLGGDHRDELGAAGAQHGGDPGLVVGPGGEAPRQILGDRDPGGVGMGDGDDLDAVLGRDADAAPVGQAGHREARQRGEGGAGAEGGVEHRPRPRRAAAGARSCAARARRAARTVERLPGQLGDRGEEGALVGAELVAVGEAQGEPADRVALDHERQRGDRLVGHRPVELGEVRVALHDLGGAGEPHRPVADALGRRQAPRRAGTRRRSPPPAASSRRAPGSAGARPPRRAGRSSRRPRR